MQNDLEMTCENAVEPHFSGGQGACCQKEWMHGMFQKRDTLLTYRGRNGWQTRYSAVSVLFSTNLTKRVGASLGI